MLPKGTLVTCPECGSHIARLTQPLTTGMALSVDQFDSIQGEMFRGQLTICRACGADWFKHGSLHTEDGWKR